MSEVNFSMEDRTTQLDLQHMQESVAMLSNQVQHAWEAAQLLELPDNYKGLRNIVLFGMGGSALGMDVVRTAFASELTVPVTIVNDYEVPAQVGEDTLVVLSSYSGTTEEVVNVSKTILERTKNIFVVTTGGLLKEFAEEHDFPAYIIDPKYNPCGQPRIAVGYAVTGMIGMLVRAGYLDVTKKDIDDVIHYLEGNRELLRDEALKIAGEASGKMPIYVASQHLLGNAHIVTNQTNENGKNFAGYHAIPELNHHLLEGLGYPAIVKEGLHFVFIESSDYHKRNEKRYRVTKAVLDKQGITHSTFVPTASTVIQQVYEVMQWGGFISFYLAMHNEIDPSPIPWVDHFKDALKK